MNKVVVGQKLIYFSGGYDKRSRDGVFTNVTHVTPTGRFKIAIDNSTNMYAPDTLSRMGKKSGFSATPYCRLINNDNKALENRAMKRLWIDRISSVDLENCTSDQLSALIATLNVNGIK